MQREPSMEEILASIRRIISEDDVATQPAAAMQPSSPDDTPLQAPADDFSDLILNDLDELAPEGEPYSASTSEYLELARQQDKDARPGAIISDNTAAVATQQLSQLSQMLIRGYEGAENTLEGLIREMLKPMLKEWLDANLPDIVEKMVAREIARITGKVE